MTTQILVLAGGQSMEHTVSLASAKCVLAAIETVPTLTAVVRVLSRTGGLLSEADSRAAIERGTEVATGGDDLSALVAAAQAADVVLPLLHGPMGEDGTVQGLLTLMQVPFVGCGVLSSALCMDKPMAKEVLRAAAIPQVPFVTLTAQAWQTGEEHVVSLIAKEFGPPWFVKPANMGSSVGITKVTTADGLMAAIHKARAFDRRIIVEAGLEAVRELEVAVIGNDTPETSPVGEICHDGTFYDYDTKYTVGHSNMVIPAEVPPEVSEKILALAVATYRLLDCAGLARIDFFYTPKDQAVYVNEVNSLPGFTTFSMFPSLMAKAGLPYGALIERLVKLALERHPAAAPKQ